MKKNEKVLVVARDVIFKDGLWQGIKTENLDYYLDLIKNNYQFKKRGEVENDPSWQQIIPYILFSFKDKFFLYKYIQGAGEKRLVDSYQLGVGGHINLIDENSIEKAAMREWREEVNFKGQILNKKLVGILNDDSSPVEIVHLGMIYHFIGDSSNISVREIDKMKGELVDLKEMGGFIKNVKGVWATIIYKEYLSKLL